MEIPFKFSFGHGAAKRKSSDSFLLVLKTNDGKIGIGEGLPRAYVTGETLNSSTEFFKDRIYPNIIQSK
ncbi:MAG: enolase, partial [Halobacteriovoraceae bacterium]|nr:enolase [Halobacteriovoraceae bacterium]